jgi:SEC-C motif domain protein
MEMSEKIALCPCGSNKPLDECCELIIAGNKDATTAEELMRSRYVAYTQLNINYLMVSHHSKTRPVRERKSIERWAKSVQWTGLVILGTEKGQENDTLGMVEFRALYIENGTLKQLHERSQFVRERGKWVYTSGEHYN